MYFAISLEAGSRLILHLGIWTGLVLTIFVPCDIDVVLFYLF